MKKENMKLRENNQRGFTLIELLVVISIIALLSSVVFAAVSSARQKGAVAAAQTFDSQTYSSFFNNVALEYNFADTKDSSGNRNDLVLNGGASLVTSPNPFNVGNTLSINPNASQSANSTSALSAYTGDFSVSFWVYMTGYDAYELMSNVSVFGLVPGTWRFAPHSNTGGLFFDVRSSTGSGVNFSGSSALAVNQWYQIVGVCGGSKVGLFINGVQTGGNAATFPSGTCSYAANQIYIKGNAIGANPTYQYYVDNVRVYQQALPMSYIQNEYLAELPRMESLAMKNK